MIRGPLIERKVRVPGQRRSGLELIVLAVGLSLLTSACLELPEEAITSRDAGQAPIFPRMDRGPVAQQVRDQGLNDAAPSLPDLGPPDDVLPYQACVGDTEPLSPSATGAWGPATRVIRMDPPETVEQAMAFGCSIHGHNRGTGLSALITLVGDTLTRNLQPNEDGVIDLILLAQLADWPAGRTGREVGDVTLKLYDGDPDPMSPGRFTVSPSSFFDPEEMRFLRAQFEGTLNGCDFTSREGDFSLSLPDLYLPSGIRLANAQIRGHISAAEAGFAMNSGILTGYVLRETLVEGFGVLSAECRESDPPEVCESLGFILEGGVDEAVDVFMSLLGGADVLVRGDTARGNCGDLCNALSICVQLSGEPVGITGLSGR